MTRPTLWLLAILSGLLLLVAGCDTDGEPAEAESEDFDESAEEVVGAEDGDLTVGLVTINLQALFFNQVNEGAERMAEEENVQLRIFNANDDPVAQNNAVENYVAQGVDAVIVLAIDTEGIEPAIEAADEAGVPVVAVDAIVDHPAVSVQVGTDNEGAGEQIGEFLADHAGGEGSVGIVGALNSTIQNTRQAGFENAVEDAGMEIANVVDGRNIQEEALSAAENLLTGNPDMDFAYATGEPALVGLISAIRSQGAQDRIEVVGWDLSEPAVEAFEEGWLIALVQQDTFRFGEEGVRAAAALARGEEVDDEIPIDVSIVTPDNFEDFLFYLED